MSFLTFKKKQLFFGLLLTLGCTGFVGAADYESDDDCVVEDRQELFKGIKEILFDIGTELDNNKKAGVDTETKLNSKRVDLVNKIKQSKDALSKNNLPDKAKSQVRRPFFEKSFLPLVNDEQAFYSFMENKESRDILYNAVKELEDYEGLSPAERAEERKKILEQSDNGFFLVDMTDSYISMSLRICLNKSADKIKQHLESKVWVNKPQKTISPIVPVHIPKPSVHQPLFDAVKKKELEKKQREQLKRSDESGIQSTIKPNFTRNEWDPVITEMTQEDLGKKMVVLPWNQVYKCNNTRKFMPLNYELPLTEPITEPSTFSRIVKRVSTIFSFRS